MPDDTAGPTIIRRLHRMVRHGYRPWLGYDVQGGGDREILLRWKDGAATIGPDGAVTLAPAGAPGRVIGAEDAAGFDALFPPNRPNRRNLVRRLYEIGVGAW